MSFYIDAAAICNIGRIRDKNEDNLFFNGKVLPLDHKNLRNPYHRKFLLDKDYCFGVFDGMGGEASGEVASYCAASSFKNELEKTEQLPMNTRDRLAEASLNTNQKVWERSEENTEGQMGSTLAVLYFTQDQVYTCNLGDSRAFRLRDNELTQITQDHVETLPESEKMKNRKPHLIQYLGASPEELRLEPYIAKEDIREGDQYLICSDGLTDMVSNTDICAALKEEADLKRCVLRLLKEALDAGGRDNITIILCRIGKRESFWERFRQQRQGE